MASSLPNEVLQHVLSFLPCERSSTATLFAFTLVSKRFSAISKSNVAWAHHLACWTDATRSLPSSNELGTAAYYRLRKKMDREAMDCVRELARATHGRTDAIAKLVSLGLNVADRLREVMAMEEKESPEEWISLRYWAKTALGVILRAAALETWSRVDDEEDASTLFDSLAAFSVHKGASPARVSSFLAQGRREELTSHSAATARWPAHFPSQGRDWQSSSSRTELGRVQSPLARLHPLVHGDGAFYATARLRREFVLFLSLRKPLAHSSLAAFRSRILQRLPPFRPVRHYRGTLQRRPAESLDQPPHRRRSLRARQQPSRRMGRPGASR